MAKDIIGSFVFRDLGDGCLLSKYVNTHSAPYPETCKFLKTNGCNDPFCGFYDSVWLETDGTVVNQVRAELEISKHTNGNYKLIWTLTTGAIYEGVGMLYGELLVGAYWNQ